VFVVGCSTGWESAAKVLFESESLSGNNTQSRGARQRIATSTERSLAYGGSNPECADTVTSKWAKGSGGPSGNECGLFVAHKVYETHPADSRVKEMGETCQTVTSRWGTGGGNVPLVQSYGFEPGIAKREGNPNRFVEEHSPTLRANMGDNQVAVAYSIREDAKANNFSATPLEVTPALQATRPSVQSHHAQTFVAHTMAVRRLTPTECERLQGFPDNYTNIKENCPDSPRYKALGNSMAVPVMKWIGQRIQKVENEK
jgi:DNA (cytosine-5)-methyltransferase 1